LNELRATIEHLRQQGHAQLNAGRRSTLSVATPPINGRHYHTLTLTDSISVC